VNHPPVATTYVRLISYGRSLVFLPTSLLVSENPLGKKLWERVIRLPPQHYLTRHLFFYLSFKVHTRGLDIKGIFYVFRWRDLCYRQPGPLSPTGSCDNECRQRDPHEKVSAGGANSPNLRVPHNLRTELQNRHSLHSAVRRKPFFLTVHCSLKPFQPSGSPRPDRKTITRSLQPRGSLGESPNIFHLLFLRPLPVIGHRYLSLLSVLIIRFFVLQMLDPEVIL